MTVYLYDTAGQWIAFRSETNGRYLFDPSGNWIGWFPRLDDDDAVSPDGEYLGTVIGDRLLRRTLPIHYEYPGYPGAPAFPGRAAYPGAAPYGGYTPGFRDVPVELLEMEHVVSSSAAFAGF
jgi:hypothetical protein